MCCVLNKYFYFLKFILSTRHIFPLNLFWTHHPRIKTVGWDTNIPQNCRLLLLVFEILPSLIIIHGMVGLTSCINNGLKTFPSFRLPLMVKRFQAFVTKRFRKYQTETILGLNNKLYKDGGRRQDDWRKYIISVGWYG